MSLSLTQPVWHAVVYHTDAPDENYYFLHEADLRTTIETTWSKKRDTILVSKPSDSLYLVKQLLDGKVLVMAKRLPALPILDGPTHF
jgi:hypothetical protein